MAQCLESTVFVLFLLWLIEGESILPIDINLKERREDKMSLKTYVPKKLSLQHGRRNKVEKVHTSRSQERKIAENMRCFLSPSPSLHLLFSFPYDEEDGKMETIARRKVSEGKEENIITLHCLIS